MCKDTNTSFNPCFNGSGSNTNVSTATEKFNYSFNPCFNGSGSNTKRLYIKIIKGWVSILVLMEVVLILSKVSILGKASSSMFQSLF